MKRKILVPTDLSVKSLNLVKEAVHESDAMELEVVLFYATHMSDSIGEMLFFSKHKLIESLSAEDFLISFDKLKESFTKRLKTISIEVFSESTICAHCCTAPNSRLLLNFKIGVHI